MEYRVIRTCYFDGRLYEKDELVVTGGPVPEHFEALQTEEPKEPKKATAKKTKR